MYYVVCTVITEIHFIIESTVHKNKTVNESQIFMISIADKNK